VGALVSLLIGIVAGLAFNLGPGALAGYLGGSLWWGIAWSFALALYVTLLKPGTYSQQKILGIAAGFEKFTWRFVGSTAAGIGIATTWTGALNTAAYFLAAWAASS